MRIRGANLKPQFLPPTELRAVSLSDGRDVSDLWDGRRRWHTQQNMSLYHVVTVTVQITTRSPTHSDSSIATHILRDSYGNFSV